MSFSSRSSRRHYGDNHQGSNYYKREGFLSRIFKMFGSFSGSDRKYDKHHSHGKHYSDQRQYSDQEHYSDHSHHRRKYKSSWS